MGEKKWDTQVNAYGTVTHDDASNIIIAANTDDLSLYLDSMNISVYVAAVGGDGILEIQDTDGAVIHVINVDGVKEFVLDIGDEGLRIGQNLGIQLLVSGADIQASVSTIITGHYNVD